MEGQFDNSKNVKKTRGKNIRGMVDDSFCRIKSLPYGMVSNRNGVLD
jgi:hypothetical protein